jgi:hypothetical protein
VCVSGVSQNVVQALQTLMAAPDVDRPRNEALAKLYRVSCVFSRQVGPCVRQLYRN